MSLKARAASRRGRSPGSLAAIQPAPNPAGVGNRRSVTHGAYSTRVKAARVREVLDELLADHPHESLANLRALAELYVTAERLSDWVAGRDDGGVSAAGKIAPRSRPRWIDVYHPLAHAAFRGLDYGVDSAAWRASVEARAA